MQRLHPLICVVAAALTFVGTLNGEYTYDDAVAVVQNSDVVGPTSLRSILRNDFWGTPLAARRTHKSYRPLTILSLRLDHVLSGAGEGERPPPRVVHAHNIALHAAASALVCLLALRLFGGGGGDERALLAGLLFAVHPVHADVVAQAVGRAELLSACFILLGLEAWFGVRLQLQLQLQLRGGDASSSSGSAEGPTLCRAALALLAALVAMLCKEQGITLLGICLLGELACATHAEHPWRQRRGAAWLAPPALLIVGGAAALVGRLWVIGWEPPLYDCNQNPASCEENMVSRAMSYTYLVARHIWLVLNPRAEQCYDWSFGTIPPIVAIDDPRNWAGAAAIVAITAWLALALTGSVTASVASRARCRALRLALALASAAFLPASNLLFPVGFTLAERVLYVPSIAAALLFALLCERTQRWCALLLRFPPRSASLAMRGLVLGILLVCAHEAAKRSAQFRDDATLFTADFFAASECGARNAKVHYNYAHVLHQRGEATEACAAYRSAIALSESRRRVRQLRAGVSHSTAYTEPKLNLAALLMATEEVSVACGVSPGFTGSRLAEAEALLRRAAADDPRHGIVRTNLAIAIAFQGRTSDAVATLGEGFVAGAFACPPDVPLSRCATAAEAHNTRGFYSMQLDQWEAARVDIDAALMHSEELGASMDLAEREIRASTLFHAALWWETSPEHTDPVRARLLYERSAATAPATHAGLRAAEKLATLAVGDAAPPPAKAAVVANDAESERVCTLDLDAERSFPLSFTLADGVPRDDKLAFSLRQIGTLEGMQAVLDVFAKRYASAPPRLFDLLRDSIVGEQSRLFERAAGGQCS